MRTMPRRRAGCTWARVAFPLCKVGWLARFPNSHCARTAHHGRDESVIARTKTDEHYRRYDRAPPSFGTPVPLAGRIRLWHPPGNFHWHVRDCITLGAPCAHHSAVCASRSRRRHTLRSVERQLPDATAHADSEREDWHRRRLLVRAGLALHERDRQALAGWRSGAH